MKYAKDIAFYVAIVATATVAMLGPTLGGLLPEGPIDIPIVGLADGKDLAGGLWLGGVMVCAMTAAGLLLSSSDDNFRWLHVDRRGTPTNRVRKL